MLDFLCRKVAKRPVGIWLAWAALFYALILGLRRLAILFGFIDDLSWMPKTTDIMIDWPILIASAIALSRRRLIARTFAGMSLVFMLKDSLDHVMPFGVLLAILGFIGIVVNRRWFDEYLPRTGW